MQEATTGDHVTELGPTLLPWCCTGAPSMPGCCIAKGTSHHRTLHYIILHTRLSRQASPLHPSSPPGTRVLSANCATSLTVCTLRQSLALHRRITPGCLPWTHNTYNQDASSVTVPGRPMPCLTTRQRAQARRTHCIVAFVGGTCSGKAACAAFSGPTLSDSVAETCLSLWTTSQTRLINVRPC